MRAIKKTLPNMCDPDGLTHQLLEEIAAEGRYLNLACEPLAFPAAFTTTFDIVTCLWCVVLRPRNGRP